MVRKVLGVLAGCVLSGVLWSGAAVAAAPGAAFSIHVFTTPSSFSIGENGRCESSNTGTEYQPCDAYQVTVRNAGDVATGGAPITVVDELPPGLTLREAEFFRGQERERGVCSGAVRVSCVTPGELKPDETLEMIVRVTVDAGAPEVLRDGASVSGGGVPGASASLQTPNSVLPVSFGFNALGASLTGVDGAQDTQAGGHPYENVIRTDLNNVYRAMEITPQVEPASVRDMKDFVVDLPLGLAGSALAAPTCTLARLSTFQRCPADTVVGHLRTEPTGDTGINGPIYNIVPEHGVLAELGFYDRIFGTHVLYTRLVPSPQGYVLQTTGPDVPQVALADIEAVLYGDPAVKDESGIPAVAQFTNPSWCSGQPLVTSVHMDSWQAPGGHNADGTPNLSDPNWASATSEAPPVTGCDALRFDASLSVRPETAVADSPTGLGVDVKVPQAVEPDALGVPPLRNTTIALPTGMSVNPAAAGGLGACSEAQIGLGSAAPPACPEDSKIGAVEVETPALAGVLQGSIYLAAQNENPFHALFAGYVVIDDATTGAVVKVPAELRLDPATGQITGFVPNAPQAQIGDVRMHFFGGPRAPLATPADCGTFTSTSDLMPWSAPDSGPDATPSSGFQVESGCGGGFAPAFTAGTADPQAGGYSPFVLSLSRQDGEQDLAGVSLRTPEGLLGKIAGIPLCPEANASAGTCPEASQVGGVTAGAGVGPDPFFVSGKVYLTGPYNGGPFGLVEEIPAVAGPFNLGNVVVRQSLRIDPVSAQVTAVSDPLPRILDGVPLRVRRVDVTLDRPGFMFNPTSCSQMAVTGTLTSTQGTTAGVSSRFQVGGCGELPFKPSFKVTTKARTSKQNGASLDVSVTSGQGQANIGKVAVTLPKQLPARLTTIQQACPEATYDANPASCPAGSDIGTATAHTPIFANPFTGPAYLVSHGGAAFPDLVIILQGEGVTLDLTGSIDIKHGITSSAFNAIPDAPISSFELSVPEGPHSGLASNLPSKAKGNMCGQKLTMPFTITGQNGAQLSQNIKIAVTGCAKAKKKPKHTKRGKKKK
jgi:hypothetical protein